MNAKDNFQKPAIFFEELIFENLAGGWKQAAGWGSLEGSCVQSLAAVRWQSYKKFNRGYAIQIRHRTFWALILIDNTDRLALLQRLIFFSPEQYFCQPWPALGALYHINLRLTPIGMFAIWLRRYCRYKHCIASSIIHLTLHPSKP